MKEIAEKFLNKKVKITTNENHYFRGKLTSITDLGIILEDIKIGTTFIAFSNIKLIEEWNERKKVF